MIRVLQIGFGYKVGGIQNCLLNFYKNLDRNEIHFDFINMTGHEHLYYEDEIKKLESKIYTVPNEYKHPIKAYKQLKRIIKENKYDIVHINKNSISSIVVLKAVKDSGVKVRILHSHNTHSDGGKVGALLHKINKNFAKRYCNVFFACSTDAAKWMYTNKIINSSSFYMINNAIDLDKYRYDEKIRKEMRDKLKISQNSVVIGDIARLVAVKNQKYLIDILKYRKNLIDTKLLLVGDGDMKDELVSYAKENGVLDDVIFTGNVPDVYNYCQAMDIFVMPSFFEGLPIAGVEAQASGLPAIFSDTITRDAKINSRTTYVSLENGSKSWSETIDKTLLDYDRNSSKKEIEECNFNIHSEAQKLQKIYQTIVKENIK